MAMHNSPAYSHVLAREGEMNPNDCLHAFLTELERLIDGHGTRHAVGTTATGQLEIRLGAGDWYWAVQVVLDEDPIEAAQRVAQAEKYFPSSI